MKTIFFLISKKNPHLNKFPNFFIHFPKFISTKIIFHIKSTEMHQNFDATSSSSFLDYVQQMESFDPSDENALKSQFDDEQPFTSLPPETKQCPRKDIHYKRSLSQYIKKKYQRSVKVTNKFAEKTYREFYHHRITENPRISRYLKVFSFETIRKNLEKYRFSFIRI